MLIVSGWADEADGNHGPPKWRGEFGQKNETQSERIITPICGGVEEAPEAEAAGRA